MMSVVLQREQFVKAVNSKSIRMFLEWFTETQMFNAFINNQLHEEGEGPGNVQYFKFLTPTAHRRNMYFAYRSYCL